MDFDIDTQIKLARPYLWLAYPLLTVIIIIISFSYLIGNSNSLLTRIGQANQKIQTNIKLKAILEAKLGVLKSVTDDVLTERLKEQAQFLPLEREIWTAISGLRTVGDLKSFYNSGNQAITVEYKVEDSLVLQKLLEKIDELKPLMSVTGVSYGAKKARLEIDVAFEPLAKLNPELDKPLPNLPK